MNTETNRTLTAEEAREAVSTIVGAAGVKYQATLMGERTNADKWTHDAWRVTFTSRTGKTFETEYSTGVGLRQLPTVKISGTTSRRPIKPMSRDNVQSPRELEQWKQRNAKPVTPHVADVICSLLSDSIAAEMTFNDWCSDYEYNNDSIKAHSTYLACQRSAELLRSIFARSQIESLRAALENY